MPVLRKPLQVPCFSTIRVLGSGANGIAKLVVLQDKAQVNTCVVKEIPLNVSTATMDEILCEAKVMRDTLQPNPHPNVIKYMNSWVQKDTLYIAMEAARHGDMCTLIEQQRKRRCHFSESDAMRFTYELSSALAHCHALRLIHRDLKPANVLVHNYSLKIADFGLSKVFFHTMRARTICGTPLYSAPELIKGAAYSFAVDNWAMGCIIYEILHLAPLWKTKGVSMQGLNQMILGTLPPFDYIRMHYSTNMVKVVTTLLLKDPTKRRSAQSVANLFVREKTTDVRVENATKSIQRSFRLQRLRRQEPTPSPPPPPPPPPLPLPPVPKPSLHGLLSPPPRVCPTPVYRRISFEEAARSLQRRIRDRRLRRL